MSLHIRNTIIIFLTLLLQGINPVFSQIYPFVNYNVENGLSQSQVYAIIQDKQGYIWLSTYGGGICKFDGNSFQCYSTLNGLSSNLIYDLIIDRNDNLWICTDGGGICRFNLSASLRTGKNNFIHYDTKPITTSPTVLRVFEDSKGNIWFGLHFGGVIKFIPQDSGKYKLITYNLKDGMTDNRVWSITEDRIGRMWFGTNGGGINILQNDSFYILNTSTGFISNYVWSLLTDYKGNVWAGTRDGLIKINANNATLDPHNYQLFTSKDGIIRGSVWKTYEQKNGFLWFGGQGGATRLNPDIDEFTTFTVENGLSDDFVKSFLEDREGNIWLGTSGGGVSVLQNESMIYYDETVGLKNNQVNAICEDLNGNIWTGHRDGLDLLILQPDPSQQYQYGQIINFTKKQGINSRVNAIYEDTKGNVWVGTSGNGAYYKSIRNGKYTNIFKQITDKEGLSNNRVNCILESSGGEIYLGTNNGITIFNNNNEIKFNRNINIEDGLTYSNVGQMVEDNEGYIWIGTYHGVNRYDPKKRDEKQIISYTKVEGLCSDVILTIVKDKKDNLWFGSNANGFDLFIPDEKGNKKFKNFNMQHGLSSNTIYLIQEDKDGNLWIGTNTGIDKFDVNEYFKSGKTNFRHYSKKEGFRGIECNQNSSYCDLYGNLWFGTIKGVTKYQPFYDKLLHIKPLTNLTRIRLFFNQIDLTPYCEGFDQRGLPINFVLPYNLNHITFDFIGLSFSIPEKVGYQYKLDGFDKNWSPLKHERFATYSNLPHGTFTFLLKSCNKDKVWNKVPVSFQFIITPPFWKTWWFYSLCLLSISASIYLYIKTRIRSYKKIQKELNELVMKRTNSLMEEKEKLELAKKEIENAYSVINQKNIDITDSLEYAKLIQQAILPKIDSFSNLFKESFIFFKPRDIVSGDFYWFAPVEMDGNIINIIAVADCTGHGVPGAFMSMIGNDLLNQIIYEKKIYKPNEILDNLHKGVRFALKQDALDSERKDGMDISICCIDMNNRKLEFASAHRPMYLINSNSHQEPINNLQHNSTIDVHNNEILKIFKGDKVGIGDDVITIKSKTFTRLVIDLKKGDIIYLFSDGFADQIGGIKNKKYMSSKFREFINSIYTLSMKEQHKKISEELDKWKGIKPQTDDVLVVGLKF